MFLLSWVNFRMTVPGLEKIGTDSVVSTEASPGMYLLELGMELGELCDKAEFSLWSTLSTFQDLARYTSEHML